MNTSKKVLFNPANHFERYNGGWTKSVTSLNKEVTNGFSIIGDFMPKDKKEWYYTNCLYLDCGIGGSRKNQSKYYCLFIVLENGEFEIIATSKGKDWATDLWEAIEAYLKKDNTDWVSKLLLLDSQLASL